MIRIRIRAIKNPASGSATLVSTAGFLPLCDEAVGDGDDVARPLQHLQHGFYRRDHKII